MTAGRYRAAQGFTLVEIMIVVAIIGLLTTLATPAFIKVRKQSQARRALNDARLMDAAIDQWALDAGRKDGDPILTNEVALYLKTPWRPKDPIGNDFLFGAVGSNQVKITSATKDALAGAGVDWGAF